MVIATCEDLLGYRDSPDVHLIRSTSLAITDMLNEPKGSTTAKKSKCFVCQARVGGSLRGTVFQWPMNESIST